MLLEVDLLASSATIIASRSRGTPRIANRLLRRVRDFAAVQGHPVVNDAVAVEALELFGVDEYGLDKIDRRILSLLCGQFANQPVGLDDLGARLWRGAGHDRRRLRAVFVARGAADPYAARAGGHRKGLPAPGSDASWGDLSKRQPASD